MCQQPVQAFRGTASTKTTGVFAFEFTHLILSSSYHCSTRKGFTRPLTLPQLHPEAPLHAAMDGRVKGGPSYMEKWIPLLAAAAERVRCHNKASPPPRLLPPIPTHTSAVPHTRPSLPPPSAQIGGYLPGAVGWLTVARL